MYFDDLKYNDLLGEVMHLQANPRDIKKMIDRFQAMPREKGAISA